MPLYQETYGARHIEIDTQEVRGRRWTWTYQIDDGPLRACQDRPVGTEPLAKSEALMQARREIDRSK